MTHGSVFSGEGGFDLAAEWMGWENKFHCEISDFCNTILNFYWPNATGYKDIRETDFTIWGGAIDVLSGGFPCQPYSVAGLRKGKDDDRHLWPEMLRAIREISPRWVVGENVRGLINWNGGLVFDEVQSDLEAAGYEVLPFLLPAAGVNAPHRRDRIFFVAHARCCNSTISVQQRRQDKNPNINTNRQNESGITSDADNNLGRTEKWELSQQQEQRRHLQEVSGITSDGTITNAYNITRWCGTRGGNRSEVSSGNKPLITHPDGEGLQRKGQYGRRGPGFIISNSTDANFIGLEGNEKETAWQIAANRNDWSQFPTQPPICSGNDGLPSRLDGITFSKWRNESIKAHGNAVVPQLVYKIFKTIESLT